MCDIQSKKRMRKYFSLTRFRLRERMQVLDIVEAKVGQCDINRARENLGRMFLRRRHARSIRRPQWTTVTLRPKFAQPNRLYFHQDFLVYCLVRFSILLGSPLAEFPIHLTCFRSCAGGPYICPEGVICNSVCKKGTYTKLRCLHTLSGDHFEIIEAYPTRQHYAVSSSFCIVQGLGKMLVQGIQIARKLALDLAGPNRPNGRSSFCRLANMCLLRPCRPYRRRTPRYAHRNAR